MYDFAKEMYFDVTTMGSKSTQDRTLLKIVKMPSIMVSASGISKTRFFIFWSLRTLWYVKINITWKKMVLTLIQLMKKFLL